MWGEFFLDSLISSKQVVPFASDPFHREVVAVLSEFLMKVSIHLWSSTVVGIQLLVSLSDSLNKQYCGLMAKFYILC